MAHNMSNFYSFCKEEVRTCPVCGEKFKPAKEHAYHIEQNKNKLVCTYSCMRKWQSGNAKKLIPMRGKKKKSKKYGAVKIVETGEIFRSISECAIHLNRPTGNVYQSIVTGVRCNGFHIVEVEEGEQNDCSEVS